MALRRAAKQQKTKQNVEGQIVEKTRLQTSFPVKAVQNA